VLASILMLIVGLVRAEEPHILDSNNEAYSYLDLSAPTITSIAPSLPEVPTWTASASTDAFLKLTNGAEAARNLAAEVARQADQASISTNGHASDHAGISDFAANAAHRAFQSAVDFADVARLAAKAAERAANARKLDDASIRAFAAQVNATEAAAKALTTPPPSNTTSSTNSTELQLAIAAVKAAKVAVREAAAALKKDHKNAALKAALKAAKVALKAARKRLRDLRRSGSKKKWNRRGKKMRAAAAKKRKEQRKKNKKKLKALRAAGKRARKKAEDAAAGEAKALRDLQLDPDNKGAQRRYKEWKRRAKIAKIAAEKSSTAAKKLASENAKEAAGDKTLLAAEAALAVQKKAAAAAAIALQANPSDPLAQANDAAAKAAVTAALGRVRDAEKATRSLFAKITWQQKYRAAKSALATALAQVKKLAGDAARLPNDSNIQALLAQAQAAATAAQAKVDKLKAHRPASTATSS